MSSWKHPEYDPHRIQGLWGVDFEERINYDRLRKDRLQKLQRAMKDDGLDAMLLFMHPNVRYATNTRFEEGFTNTLFFRSALVLQNSPPILFELIGEEQRNRELQSPWIAKRMKPSIIWDRTGAAKSVMAQRWADDFLEILKDEGVSGGKIGVDRVDLTMVREMDKRKVQLIDAWPTLTKARLVKTNDELELLKHACNMVDTAFYQVRHTARPGLRECDLGGMMMKTFWENGAEAVQALVVASGGHTNPYFREFSDKPLREGDLLILDEGGLSGPGGYKADFVRCYLIGDKNPTEEQKSLFKECYDSMYDAIKVIKPGATTKDIANKFPVYEDDKVKTTSMIQWAHGLGMLIPEEPTVSRGHSLDFPERIEEGMYMALETYSGKPGGKEAVRLEENFVVTDTGVSIFSLAPHDEKLMREI